MEESSPNSPARSGDASSQAPTGQAPTGQAPAGQANISGQPKTSGSWLGRIVVWLLVFLVFGGVIYWVVRSQSTPQKAAQMGKGAAMGGAIAVVPATAKKGDIGVYQEAIGTVTPVYTSSITSQVTGIISAVRYKEGQLVQKGAALIEIDPRPFEAQLAQAQGTLEKDTQVLNQATMDLDRYRAAWARNAIAKQILDDQEKLVAQDQGTVKSDRGTVQYDEVQVGWCHITAPFTGRAGLRLIDPGNVVQANGSNPLVVITQEQPITVIFTISEDAVAAVQRALRHGARLTVDAYDRGALTKIAAGRLLTLDNQIDTTTGTLKLRALFENKDGALFPNQFVNARLLVETLKDKTLIPGSAIQHNGQVAFVYLIQNGAVQMRTVTTGASNGGLTAVEGIQPGDVVANSSFEKLQPNAKVKLVAPSQPATGPEAGLP